MKKKSENNLGRHCGGRGGDGREVARALFSVNIVSLSKYPES